MKIIIFFLCIINFSIVRSQELHLYGGKDHDVYLGCLTCDKYDSNSIWNTYGKYGNSYNKNCIWNQYGAFGNKYNSLSPWNEYSTESPVVVDKEGKFYGYFTRNKYRNKRANFKLALLIYKYYDVIKDDVQSAYEEIFE